jgi:hypothetical protein
MRLVATNDDGSTIFVTRSEYNALISGLRETLEALEDWEFHTRTGVEPSAMRELLDALLAIDPSTE